MARMLRHLDEEFYVQHGRLCLYGGTDCPEFRVTMLGTEDGHHHVRDAERVVCSEETWSD